MFDEGKLFNLLGFELIKEKIMFILRNFYIVEEKYLYSLLDLEIFVENIILFLGKFQLNVERYLQKSDILVVFGLDGLLMLMIYMIVDKDVNFCFIDENVNVVIVNNLLDLVFFYIGNYGLEDIILLLDFVIENIGEDFVMLLYILVLIVWKVRFY